MKMLSTFKKKVYITCTLHCACCLAPCLRTLVRDGKARHLTSSVCLRRKRACASVCGHPLSLRLSVLWGSHCGSVRALLRGLVALGCGRCACYHGVRCRSMSTSAGLWPAISISMQATLTARLGV